MSGQSIPPVLHHFREQAGWCRNLGSALTADLCLAFADDFEAKGPVFDLVSGWPGNPRKDALALRLAGCLHHAVLTDKAPALASEYPAAREDWSVDCIWPVAKRWLAENRSWVTGFIKSPPQTNETRRAIALLPGFLALAEKYKKPIHLLELGASAGLNQNWDSFRYETGSWSWGQGDVCIQTDWQAPVPEHLSARPVVETRQACDLNPIDLSDPDQLLRLKCYTWPDQTERLERLDAAIALARRSGTRVDRASAQDWLIEKLRQRPENALTVVFHSVFLIYPPRETIGAIMSAIAEEGARATPDKPLAWLCYESEALFGGDSRSPAMLTRLQSWPDGGENILNRSDGHVTRVMPA